MLTEQPRELLIWAHRGASADAPENTLAAFRLAEQQGADGIELDVHLSRDGIPVVIHDDRVDRTTNGVGAVAELRARELRSLDAGRWFAPRFSGEKIPLLADVLAWAEDRLLLNLEIKSLRAGEATLALVEQYPSCHVLLSSFNHRLLLALRRKSSTIALGFLSESPFWHLALRRAVQGGAYSFHPREDLAGSLMIQKARRLGLAVYPWTLDDARRARTLMRQGIDGLFSNRPGALREELCCPSVQDDESGGAAAMETKSPSC